MPINQIQECLSFLSIAYKVCCMLEDKIFAEKVYDSGVNWLESTRMTLNKGLVEMLGNGMEEFWKKKAQDVKEKHILNKNEFFTTYPFLQWQ